MTKSQRAEAQPKEKRWEPKSRPTRAADRIRSSARNLFYHQGSRAVGVDAIEAEAGVTRPSLCQLEALLPADRPGKGGLNQAPGCI